jgi:hypothetical protein
MDELKTLKTLIDTGLFTNKEQLLLTLGALELPAGKKSLQDVLPAGCFAKKKDDTDVLLPSSFLAVKTQPRKEWSGGRKSKRKHTVHLLSPADDCMTLINVLKSRGPCSLSFLQKKLNRGEASIEQMIIAAFVKGIHVTRTKIDVGKRGPGTYAWQYELVGPF